MNYSIECGDCIEWLKNLPDDCADLLVTSPPYEAARTYSIGFSLRGQEWVDWMVDVVRAAAPKVRGLIAVNCEGQTRDYRYSATPFLLAADLHRAGFNLRKPVVFHRVGIPGSGGPDWLRNDWEPVVCVTRPGKMPWSNPTALGKPPKHGPGGVMSHRVTDGTRVKQDRVRGLVAGGMSQRAAARQVGLPLKTVTTGSANGDIRYGKTYIPPELTNPGNVIRCKVGGGCMGHNLAHENEAPYPLRLAEFFVLSFCPPGGLTLDPFSGSGTTAHAAILHGRRFAGCDVRESQVELTKRRLATITPTLPLEDNDARHQGES